MEFSVYYYTVSDRKIDGRTDGRAEDRQTDNIAL